MDYDKVISLVESCKEVETFKFQELLILGSRVSMVKKYVELNPSKSFRVWLLDSKLVLKQ